MQQFIVKVFFGDDPQVWEIPVIAEFGYEACQMGKDAFHAFFGVDQGARLVTARQMGGK
jgi:hypothetical protein